MPTCPYCGERLKDADNFCTRCGRRQPARAAVPAPARVSGGVQPARVPTTGRPMVAQAPSRAPQPACVPASHPTARPAPRPSRQAASRQTPRPTEPASQREPRTPLGGVTAGLTAVSFLFALAFAVCCAVAPVLGISAPGEAQGRSDAVVQTVLGSVDPQVSLVASGLIGASELNVPQAVQVGAQLAEALGDGQVALGVGLAAGLIAASALLAVAGALAAAVCRRPSGVLCAGATVALVVSAVGAALLGTLDHVLVSSLRSATSLALAEQGLQLSASTHLVAATPWLYVLVACALVACACALVARARWSRARRAAGLRR